MSLKRIAVSDNHLEKSLFYAIDINLLNNVLNQLRGYFSKNYNLYIPKA